MNTEKFIKNFILVTFFILLTLVGLVILFDPFYAYHKPLPGLKAALNDKEYQCIGTLRHFDYDSLIVGSSVCENYNNHWFDENFNCTAIKAIRSYGATADLCYMLDIAYENHDIKKIFYNIDTTALHANTELTYEQAGCPTYLYDKNILNDIPYLLNKDVITKKIPYKLAVSMMDSYDEGDSYNWAQWKIFSEEMARSNYPQAEEITTMFDRDHFKELREKNIELLINLVKNHPQTQFYFFISPYSKLWWDYCYRAGELDAVLYDEQCCFEALLPYENVNIYFYQDEEDIITNLDNYMDPIHFSKDINHLLCTKMANEEGKITLNNYKEVIQNMHDLVLAMVNDISN